jgi:hypothetical protein
MAAQLSGIRDLAELQFCNRQHGRQARSTHQEPTMNRPIELESGHVRADEGQRLVLPGSAPVPKLPLPLPPPLPLPTDTGGGLAPELRAAWLEYMATGFKQNEHMFKRTLEAYMRPYQLTMWMYVILFGLGIGLFLVAAVVGLGKGDPVVAIAFAGLSVASFLAFFLRQPLHALEENLEFITWLGVSFNTYWTRLMYMMDPTTVQAELKAAEADFRASVEKLIEQHAALRDKRPGGS